MSKIISQNRPYGVMFHHFHSERHIKGQGSISGEQFSDMLEYLGIKNFLPAGEWLERAVKGTLGAKDLCLTFDDGLRCGYDVAYPVMRSLGLTGFWFVYTSVMQGKIERLELYRKFRMSRFDSIEDFYREFDKLIMDSEFSERVAQALNKFDVNSHLKEYTFYTPGDRKFRYMRDDILGESDYFKVMDGMLAAYNYDIKAEAADLWMDNDCLRRLDNEGNVIGLHSHSHPTRMAQCPVKKQRKEYSDNFDHLAGVLHKDPATVSHPCNSYSQETLKILRGLGIRVGFRANLLVKNTPSSLEYPRADHADVLKEMRP